MNNKKNIYSAIIKVTFLIVAITVNYCSGADKALHRDKRYLLVYPRGGTFKIVLGFAIPVKLGSKQSMSIGWNMQFQYVTAQNITQLRTYPPVVARGREKRDSNEVISDRAAAYLGFEAILEREGINGRDCLLRSICENAVASAFHKSNGLYGQLLHITLTPDYGDGEVEPDLDPVYLEAQRAGEFGIDCHTLYTNCNYGNGLLDIISILHD